MIYLYGAVDDPAAAARAISAGEAGPPVIGPLSVIEAEGMACITSCCDSDGPAGGMGPLLAHDRILRQVMTSCTVIPFRFGSTVGDRSELTERLGRRASDWIPMFHYLRGRRELALRARSTPRGGIDRDSTGGRRYLRELAGRASAPSVGVLHQVMAGEAIDSVVEYRGTTMKSAYLVDEDSIEAFCSRLAEVQAAVDGVDVSLTGPWAAYSFVGGSALPTIRSDATGSAVEVTR